MKKKLELEEKKRREKEEERRKAMELIEYNRKIGRIIS